MGVGDETNAVVEKSNPTKKSIRLVSSKNSFEIPPVEKRAEKPERNSAANMPIVTMVILTVSVCFLIGWNIRMKSTFDEKISKLISQQDHNSSIKGLLDQFTVQNSKNDEKMTSIKEKIDLEAKTHFDSLKASIQKIASINENADLETKTQFNTLKTSVEQRFRGANEQFALLKETLGKVDAKTTINHYQTASAPGFLNPSCFQPCKPSERVVSGGCSIQNSNEFSFKLMQSYPKDNGWHCMAGVDFGTHTRNQVLTCYAVCMGI